MSFGLPKNVFAHVAQQRARYERVPAREAKIDEANRERRAAEFDELKSLLTTARQIVDAAALARQQQETLAAVKSALAAMPPQAYASIDPELKAREISDASGLSGHAGVYEEILRAVKAAVARANSPEAQAQRFLDAKALADAGGRVPVPTGLAKQILDAAALARAGGHEIPPPPRGSLAAQIIEAGRKSREGEGSK